MLLHKNPLFAIYFGDSREKFIPAHVANLNTTQEILTKVPFDRLKKCMKLNNLVFLHQVHGVHGVPILSYEQLKDSIAFSDDGDYLITALPGVGLGIAAADCLPIVIYDNFNQVIANVHAGWRGSVESIVVVAVEQMISLYGSELKNLQFFFGPSAKVCCYEVKEDTLPFLEKFSYAADVIQKHDTYYTLNVPLLSRLQLEGIGVKKEAFHLCYNVCTMCNPLFCSYRRSKNTERQMTVVALTF